MRYLILGAHAALGALATIPALPLALGGLAAGRG